MLWLRNINQYDKSVREEFEHIIGQLTVFLSQIFDEDGNFVAGSAGGDVVDIYYGDVAVNNGNSTGSSTLPRSFPQNESTLHWLGQKGAGGSDASSIQITLNSDGIHVNATRTGTAGDGNVSYMVVRHNVAS